MSDYPKLGCFCLGCTLSRVWAKYGPGDNKIALCFAYVALAFMVLGLIDILRTWHK